MNAEQPIGQQLQNLNIQEKMGEGLETLKDTATGAFSNVSNAVSGAATSVTNSMNDFSNQSVVSAGQDFLNSNSIIAKFVFIIFIVVAFMFIFNLGVYIIGLFSEQSSSPYLVQGTMNGNVNTVVPQDPNNSSAISIMRSNNKPSGMEFTWCIWLNITSLAPPTYGNHWQHIFNKGDANWITSDPALSGISSVNNGPGLYLDASTNRLRVVMDTVSPSDLKSPITMTDIENVPLRKWFHCAIRMQNKVMDIYINGTVAARTVFDNVPKQNYNDVLITQNGGFNGALADLRYYDHALNVTDITSMVAAGRNTFSAKNGSAVDATGYPFYLSNLWYK